MSATSKKEQSNASDHQLNTLTDVVRIVGETRSDVKVIDRKVDRVEQKIDTNQQENRDRFDQQGSDIAELKEMLQTLLSRWLLPALIGRGFTAFLLTRHLTYMSLRSVKVNNITLGDYPCQ